MSRVGGFLWAGSWIDSEFVILVLCYSPCCCTGLSNFLRCYAMLWLRCAVMHCVHLWNLSCLPACLPTRLIVCEGRTGSASEDWMGDDSLDKYWPRTTLGTPPLVDTAPIRSNGGKCAVAPLLCNGAPRGGRPAPNGSLLVSTFTYPNVLGHTWIYSIFQLPQPVATTDTPPKKNVSHP